VSEFQEIASSGGKIELLYQEGGGVALQFTHANPHVCGAIQTEGFFWQRAGCFRLRNMNQKK
jgi:hypothetical protein